MTIQKAFVGMSRAASRVAGQLAPSGNVYWVKKAADTNYNQFYQQHYYENLAGEKSIHNTITSALAACKANQGDVTLVSQGYTETIGAADLALNKAGVSIIGLGKGLDRPTFTYSAAGSTVNVTAANCSWENCHFIANADNVAATFTIGAGKDFTLKNNTFDDTSSALHFVSIVVTNATDQDAEGLKVLNNRWNGLAVAPNAFISILAATDRLLIDGNTVFMDATNDVGHFITLAAKVILEAQISNNRLVVVGATTASVGIFLTGSATTSKGIVHNNYVSSLDTTGELIATAGTGLVYFENYYTGTADASGKLWPAVDTA